MNEKVSPTRVVPVVLHKKVLRSVVEALDLHCEALPYDVLVTYKVKSKVKSKVKEGHLVCTCTCTCTCTTKNKNQRGPLGRRRDGTGRDGTGRDGGELDAMINLTNLKRCQSQHTPARPFLYRLRRSPFVSSMDPVSPLCVYVYVTNQRRSWRWRDGGECERVLGRGDCSLPARGTPHHQ